MPTPRDPRLRVIASFLLDMVLPLALYYGLRAFDVNQWLALVIGGVLPVFRLGHTLSLFFNLRTWADTPG